jgi:AraC family transcriptional regulator
MLNFAGARKIKSPGARAVKLGGLMPPDRHFLLLLAEINRRVDRGVSLASIAGTLRQSRFALHREFRRVAGETLKQFTLRLQLERAAARLLAGDEAIMSIALTSGFASHEVFTRAFRRHFGISPTHYRNRGSLRLSGAQRRRHVTLTRSIGPCIRFFHHPTYKKFFRPRDVTSMPTLSITRKEQAAQPILYIRRRIAPSELQSTLGECFGALFGHGAKNGLPIAGWPLCRYISTGQGLWTIEAAMPLAVAANAEGDMQAGELRRGPVALGIHAGPYEQLPDTNAAIERWIEANGYEVGGAPWEQYVTDPGQHPDPADWRTEVYWPLAE